MKNKTMLFAIILAAILIVGGIVYFMLNSGKKYEVSFNSDGGSKLSTIYVNKNDTINLPKDPVKEGYKFDGWLLDGKKFSDTTKITKDITLKAS